MSRRRPQDPPTDLEGFGPLLTPKEAQEPILAMPVRTSLTEWLEEIWAEDELKKVGIASRKRALFDGPPGVGKTTLAHHLAARIGLQMLVVRSEAVVDAWLGSTSRNIGALFDAAANEPVVLFFDEFDGLAAARSHAGHSLDDEKNRWVNVLLARIERHGGFIIAATNHGKTIDPAIWRRFDVRITLELPGQFERREILRRYLLPFGLPAGPLDALAAALETASPALIRQFCEGLKRQIVIGPKLSWDMRAATVVARVVGALEPHPELGKPRLWSKGADDPAVAALPWPLPLASELPKETASDAKVVRMAKRGRP